MPLEYRDFFEEYKDIDFFVVRLKGPLSEFMQNPVASYIMWEYGVDISKSFIESDFSKQEQILFVSKNFTIPRVLITSNKMTLNNIISVLRNLKARSCLLGFDTQETKEIGVNDLEAHNLKINKTVEFKNIKFFLVNIY